MTREKKIEVLSHICDPLSGCDNCVLNDVIDKCLNKDWGDYTEAQLDISLLKLGFPPEKIVEKAEPATAPNTSVLGAHEEGEQGMTDKERDQIISELTNYCGCSDGCQHCPINNKLSYCLDVDWADMTDERLEIAAQTAGIDKAPQPDMVNKPNHYQLPGGLECWDVMVAMFGADEVKIWAKINAFTYLFRRKRKNGEEDIRKALVNLQKYFELAGEDE